MNPQFRPSFSLPRKLFFYLLRLDGFRDAMEVLNERESVMRILNWEHGRGKTTELVRMMMQPGNEDVVYVAPTFAQADYALAVATDLCGGVRPAGLQLRFTSVFALGQRHGFRERYVIDEFDGVLRSLLGAEVLAVAGTCETQKPGGSYGVPRQVELSPETIKRIAAVVAKEMKI